MGKVVISLSVASIYILMVCSSLHALGDGSSSNIDLPAASGLVNFQEEKGNSLTITAGFENVLKKRLADNKDAGSARIEGTWALVGLGYRIFGDRFEPYIRVGVSEMDLFWNQLNNDIIVDAEPSFATAAGLKILAFRGKLTNFAKLKLNLEGQLRYTKPNIDIVTVGGATRSVTAEDFRFIEGRAAATVGFEISLKKFFGDDDLFEEDEINYYLVPYVGVLYTNSLVKSEFNDNGTLYDLNETNEDKNFHLVGGIDLIAPKYVILNLEAQVFDGESISGGATIKF